METIARFSRPEEASLAKSHLAGSGIRAFVAEEHSMHTDWLSAAGLGGIRLQVRGEDAATAREILGLAPEELSQEPDSPEWTRPGRSGIACPACRSVDWDVARLSGVERLRRLWRALSGGSIAVKLLCRVCRRTFWVEEKEVDGG